MANEFIRALPSLFRGYGEAATRRMRGKREAQESLREMILKEQIKQAYATKDPKDMILEALAGFRPITDIAPHEASLLCDTLKKGVKIIF